MNDSTFNLETGDLPLLVSVPHLGTCLPPDIREQMTVAATSVSDTDWHLDQLYDFVLPLGATMISACVSRYVIDLNRPPDGSSLYPGQTTTGLCPLETFHGEPIYIEGHEPGTEEVARRMAQYYQPYHDALSAQIDAIRKKYGFVLLWEAHSIDSFLPRLFDGRLPDLNFGTADGKSCAPGVQQAVAAIAREQEFSWVLNGRFKGGYITRHYGNPSQGVHAVQLEMAQKIYMDECAPYNYRPEAAASVQPVLAALLKGALEAAGRAGDA